MSGDANRSRLLDTDLFDADITGDAQSPIHQHLGQLQPLRPPSVQDRLHHVGHEAGEWQEPADIGVSDVTPSCSARSVIDFA